MTLSRDLLRKHDSHYKPARVCLRSAIISLLAATILLISSIAAAAQTEPAGDDEVLRVSTDLLLFPIRVKDARGSQPGLLTEQDLSLKDDDQVTSGLYFSHGVDRVAMIFALDQSGSLRDAIRQQAEAALSLYRQFSNKSSIAVLHFAETGTIAAAFEHDTDAALNAFNLATHANEHTAIFDAVGKAIEMFDTLPRVRTERRIVILISDGLDNASKIKPETVIEMARHKRVSFYVIQLPLFEPRDGRLMVRRPARGFRELAEKTGGKYFLNSSPALNPATKIDLAPFFQAIEDDLKSQYLLGFYLNEKSNDGRRHIFSLSVPPGVEYRAWNQSYSRNHKFFVERPREALKPLK
jgi:Ca-activated chloride channel family protein